MIIGITGRLQAGKTSFAEFLVEELKARGRKAQIAPFAKPLKDFFTLLGWDGKKDEKGRRGLQLLGTDVGRECIDDNIWVDKWTNATDALLHDGIIVIADDVRFESEAQKIQDMEGLLYEIQRPGFPSVKTLGLIRRILYKICSYFYHIDTTHASEKGVDTKFIRYAFLNTSDLSSLRDQAEILAENILYLI